jgi:uncharacterized iron-regulated membrane protein
MKRRLWFAWHSAIGCRAGLLLFVICGSGTFAVLSREVDWLIGPRLRAPRANRIAWCEAYEALRAAHPERRVTQLNAQSSGLALEAWTEDPDGVLERLDADPRSGARIGATSYFTVPGFFRCLHMCISSCRRLGATRSSGLLAASATRPQESDGPPCRWVWSASSRSGLLRPSLR